MRGYCWAICSVLLVTASQLALRGAASQLHAFTLSALAAMSIPLLLLLVTGLAGYLLSMICWMTALRHLPLSRAYPVLSLSYILVWGFALVLPLNHERFQWGSLPGVVMIVVGVYLIVKSPNEAKQNG
ncbi:4-amino-4-deoxy-L-arabinose-phosphoundecaprenol flippase subunit ArnF [Nissabacter sp. SGAir0207]|uniref:4-amino-4-deoxy-L-arabinose-phosphoundecaprenol flippase subunit ArnF n=1 Tax=Nissabacter sp. SGAir0207 TaxID=2126321 RepID=UPI0010CCD762|nr:4-amino-4-deoxy-L-arabinose-phosphoundecaprenol flippase subunit ArnF [Nissabacter sp. SGAir0207]QCR38640.1 4-amino-4-deoxy-L-arabinose-phospho-UDP flippase [Nissabacter sp. SGAir0207]